MTSLHFLGGVGSSGSTKFSHQHRCKLVWSTGLSKYKPYIIFIFFFFSLVWCMVACFYVSFSLPFLYFLSVLQNMKLNVTVHLEPALACELPFRNPWIPKSGDQHLQFCEFEFFFFFFLSFISFNFKYK